MTAESHASDAPTQLSIALYTLSDTRTPTTDESGQYLREQVEAAGHTVADYRVVREDPGALRQALIDCSGRRDVQAVICTGGTGIGPRDGTYEAIEKLLDKRLEGFGELFRALSFAEIGSAAMLSRATAGLMHTTVVVALPGSPAAVRLGWEKILREQLPHMVAVAREAVSHHPEADRPAFDPPTRPGKIKHLAEIPFEDIHGARIIRTLARDELPQVGADYVIIRPNTSLAPHRHEIAESFLFIVKGSARVSLDGEAHDVKAGDFIYVPERVSHGFETLDEACEFYSIQSPPIYPIGEPADITFADPDE